MNCSKIFNFYSNLHSYHQTSAERLYKKSIINVYIKDAFDYTQSKNLFRNILLEEKFIKCFFNSL
ncbi:hypothetical protein [Flavobacterium sp. CS20]|uniref:hypothetical protein n=1 Tax=Flavobacterium sp. CS20 TaxID=2775246 RepID=UPI001B39F011|nr:hypothetical protein [Flavobacterium sp. CS20]QTY27849.1 hypothetical protein IGB25_04875 [Flavobacterium sp. CS20]